MASWVNGSTCNQWQSVAIGGNQWQSVAISGNQWQSVAIDLKMGRGRAA